MNPKQFAALVVLLAALVVGQGLTTRWPPSAYAADRAATLEHNQNAVAEIGSEDILASDIEANDRFPEILRAAGSVATTGILSLVIKDADGVVLDSVQFSSGTALGAKSGYMLDWITVPGQKYNYRTSASSSVTLTVLKVRD